MTALWAHTHTDTTHAVAQKVEFYEKETGGGGTSALVLVLVLELGGR